MNQTSHVVDTFKSHGLLWLVTLVAAYARLSGLGSQSLWMDEFLTFNEAKMLATEGFLQIFAKYHLSPFYDMAVALLLKVGLDSEFWIRLPSALAGIACVPVSYFLVCRLFQHRSMALATAFLVAISPLAIWYSQEARGYSFLLLFSMLFVYLSWSALTRKLSLKEQVGLSLCTLAGFLTHPYIVMTAATFGIFLLLNRGIRDRALWSWAAAEIVAVIVLIPWFVVIFNGDGSISAGSVKPQMTLWIPYTLFTFVGGFSLGPTVAELRSANYVQALLAYLPLLTVASLASIAAFYIGFKQSWTQNRLATIWCLAWLFIPMLLVIVISLVSNINYNVRYVIASYPAIAIVIGGAVVAAKQRSWAAISSVAFLLAVTIWALSNWYTDPKYAKPDMRSVADLLTEIRAEDGRNEYWIASHGIVCSFLPYYDVICPESTAKVDHDNTTLDHAISGLQHLQEGRGEIFYFLEYRALDNGSTPILRTVIDSHAILLASYSWGTEISMSKYKIGVGIGKIQ